MKLFQLTIPNEQHGKVRRTAVYELVSLLTFMR